MGKRARNVKADFEAWLSHPDQGITIHPSLDIRHHAGSDEYGVYANADIPVNTIVMTVPKEPLLTPRTCGISNLLQDTEMDAMTAVCLAYLYERHQGSDSPWHAYLSCCPTTVPISKLWNKQDQRILKGSEVSMVGGTTLSDFKDSFVSVIKPFLKQHRRALGLFASLSFEQFCSGMSVVGSRAFEIDVYHGLGMCPFADMLDHEVHEHVHFQTTFDVCPECGELGHCEHDPESESEDEHSQTSEDEHDLDSSHEDDDDQDMTDDDEQDTEEDDNRSAAAQLTVEPHKDPAGHLHSHIHDSHCHHGDHHEHEHGNDDEDDQDCCEFIVTRPIVAGAQVYNTYGDLGNDVLLARYGFALPLNPHDKLSLASEVFTMLKPYRAWFETNGKNLIRALHRTDEFMAVTESSDEEETESEDELYIDVHGHPSETLLVYLLISTVPFQQLDMKSGPEVLATVQMLLGAWQYVQPGRMPLPKFLFLNAIKSVQSALASFKQVLEERRKRYTIAYDKIDRNAEVKHHQYARIVRHCEEKIVQRGKAYSASIERACAWLLQR